MKVGNLLVNGSEAFKFGGWLFSKLQSPGSILIFPFYKSDSNNLSQTNTEMSINNLHSEPVDLSLFFVSDSGHVTHSPLTVLASSRSTFNVSDIDPNRTGFVIVVAKDSNSYPTSLNYLSGQSNVYLQSGNSGIYNGYSFKALKSTTYVEEEQNITLTFDGINYDYMPGFFDFNSASCLSLNKIKQDSIIVIATINGDLNGGMSKFNRFKAKVSSKGKVIYAETSSPSPQTMHYGTLAELFPTSDFDELFSESVFVTVELQPFISSSLFGLVINNSGIESYMFDQVNVVSKSTSIVYPVRPISDPTPPLMWGETNLISEDFYNWS